MSMSVFVNDLSSEFAFLTTHGMIDRGKVLATPSQTFMHGTSLLLHYLTVITCLLVVIDCLRKQAFPPINPTLLVGLFAEAFVP